MPRPVRVGLGTAAALALLGLVEVLLCRAVLAQWQVVRSPGPASPDEALTLVVVAVAAVLGGWLALSTVAALGAHLPGRLGVAAGRWARAWAPAFTRRVAAVLVGAAMGGALAPGTAVGDATALGDGSVAMSVVGPGFTTTARPAAVAGTDLVPDPAPGWTPVRPAQRPQPAADLVTGPGARRATAEVVVHRGDTLWDLARRQLGPEASDAEVAEAWPAWHEANRAVIGDDPDLILPGQVLRAPSGAASAAVVSSLADGGRHSGAAR